ncbi:MAG: M20 family peptidase [Chloroflexi bacterium]|nr:M20 family peptidase [Chloroflexota bacterium]
MPTACIASLVSIPLKPRNAGWKFQILISTRAECALFYYWRKILMRPVEQIWEHIDPERMSRLALELVRIPSPTLANRQVAERLGQEFQAIGLEVSLYHPMPESTVVVARLPGTGGGPCLEFIGHNDHVPLEHATPEIRDGRLYGRGSLDMKAAVASVVEAVRALKASGIRLKGDILITSQGLHESPGKYEHSEDRKLLMDQGIRGDACIVVEGPWAILPIRHIGLIVYEVEIERDGEVTHELAALPGTPNPLLLAAQLALRIDERSQALALEDVPLLGPDTYHVGIIQGGDYFNRFPNKCRVVGTRRYNPARSFAQCQAELEAIAAQVVAGTGARARVQLKNSATAGEISAHDPLVAAFQAAHQEVVGDTLPLAGLRVATDVLMFLERGIPTICHGSLSYGDPNEFNGARDDLRGGGHHGDVEWIALSELDRYARLWTAAAIHYCGVSEEA